MSDGPPERPGDDDAVIAKEAAPGSKVLILHIGAPWAGASAIQAFLAANRQAVLASGLQYPRLDRGREGPRGAQAGGNGDELANLLGQPGDDALLEGLKLADHILAGRRARVLLSSEGFWNTPPARFGDLARHLAPRDGLKVVAYVRPQVEQAVSAYLESVASGRGDSARDLFDGDQARFMPAARLAGISEQLGDANLVIRKHQAERWTDAELVGDFLGACGIQARPEDRRRTAFRPAPDVEHYLYARMAGSLPGSAAAAANQLFRNPLLAPLYRRAQPIRGLQVMDEQTARHIADACHEDNLLLDELAPNADLHLNDDNRRAVETIAAEADAPLEGVSRASLLLLGRLAELEARMVALRAAAELPETTVA